MVTIDEMEFFDLLERSCGRITGETKAVICDGLSILARSLSQNMKADLIRVAQGDPFLPFIQDYFLYRHEIICTELKEATPELIRLVSSSIPLSPALVWIALLKELMRFVGRKAINKYKSVIAIEFHYNNFPEISLYDSYRYLHIVTTLAFNAWEHNIIIMMIRAIDLLVSGIDRAVDARSTGREFDIPNPKANAKYLIVLNTHNWHRDRRFLMSLCSAVTSKAKENKEQNKPDADPYGKSILPFPDVFILALGTTLNRRARRQRWECARTIQRAVRKYIYGPGMPGSSRGNDLLDVQGGRLRQEELALPILLCRSVGRRLINRLSRRELLEILRRYGSAHGIEVE